MRLTDKQKLSQLSDEQLISYEDSNEVITVAELREKIKSGENETNRKWYGAIKQNWQADAKAMIEQYIDNCYDEMYEDWDERAINELNKHPEQLAQIQTALNEIFSDDYVKEYWLLGQEIEIDIQEEE